MPDTPLYTFVRRADGQTDRRIIMTSHIIFAERIGQGALDYLARGRQHHDLRQLDDAAHHGVNRGGIAITTQTSIRRGWEFPQDGVVLAEHWARVQPQRNDFFP